MPQYEHSEIAFLTERPIEEIVGREPSWIVNSGITLISIIFLALLILTWFIRYPDTIRSQIVITTLQPPVEIVSKVSGQILQLYVGNNEKVNKGQALFLLDSSVEYQDLVSLEAELSTLKIALDSSSPIVEELNNYRLGELQSNFDKLANSIKAFKIEHDSEQLSMHISHTTILKEQYQLLKQQLMQKQTSWAKKLKLEGDVLQKKRDLFEIGVMTSGELLPLENSYLDKQLVLDDINIQANLYDVKLNELSYSLSENRTQRQEKLQQLKNAIYSYYSVLSNEINDWKKRYLIQAPITGQVSFLQYWSVNQYISAGDVVVIVANNNKDIAAKIQVNRAGIGKIKVGQRVDIELESYPAVEYGQLVGTIASISSAPGTQGYLVDVSLPTKLLTTYGKQLPFSPNLVGQAKIITEEKRLIERFLEKILYVFS